MSRTSLFVVKKEPNFFDSSSTHPKTGTPITIIITFLFFKNISRDYLVISKDFHEIALHLLSKKSTK